MKVLLDYSPRFSSPQSIKSSVRRIEYSTCKSHKINNVTGRPLSVGTQNPDTCLKDCTLK